MVAVSVPASSRVYGITVSASPPDIGVTSGVFKQSGNLGIAAPVNVAPPKRQVIYVTGNLYISNNIVYQGRGGWASVASLPGLKFIVDGNILIGNTVSQLDGIYIAKGSIYTCTTFNTPVDLSAAGGYDACNHPLTVNGSLVAGNKVYLLRTNGSLQTDTPAETINLTPETWLANWPDATATTTTQKYDSVTGLPPML
jgi:hypothetical protein